MPGTPRRTKPASREESPRRNLVIAVAVVTGYAALGAASLVAAAHLHGAARFFLRFLGIVGIGILVLWAASMTFFGLGWAVVTTVIRRQPSTVQRLGWATAAVAAGAVLGVGTYEFGLGALLGGPALPVIAWTVATAVRAQGFGESYMTRRVTWFFIVAAVVSVPVGLTVLL